MNLHDLINAGKALSRHDVKVESVTWRLSLALERLTSELASAEQYDLWKRWPCGAMASIDEEIVIRSGDYRMVRVLCYDLDGNPEYWIDD